MQATLLESFVELRENYSRSESLRTNPGGGRLLSTHLQYTKSVQRKIITSRKTGISDATSVHPHSDLNNTSIPPS